MTDYLSLWSETLCQRQEKPDVIYCWLDVSAVTRDLLLTFVWILILIYTCGAVKRNRRTQCLQPNDLVVSRYSLHDLRWLLALFLLVVHLADLGQLLLVYKKNPIQITSLSIILPVCNALVVAVSCLFFDRLEVIFNIFLLSISVQYITTNRMKSNDTILIASHIDSMAYIFMASDHLLW